MKRAVSVSLGSSTRDKRVVVTLGGEQIVVERIGADGDVARARQMFTELDGQVDALGGGGVDLYLRFQGCEYPLHAALKLVENVRQTPVVDGRGLKHTLERRVFELAAEAMGGVPHFRCGFVGDADRLCGQGTRSYRCRAKCADRRARSTAYCAGVERVAAAAQARGAIFLCATVLPGERTRRRARVSPRLSHEPLLQTLAQSALPIASLDSFHPTLCPLASRACFAFSRFSSLTRI
jgi:hypothetical protein